LGTGLVASSPPDESQSESSSIVGPELSDDAASSAIVPDGRISVRDSADARTCVDTQGIAGAMICAPEVQLVPSGPTCVHWPCVRQRPVRIVCAFNVQATPSGPTYVHWPYVLCMRQQRARPDCAFEVQAAPSGPTCVHWPYPPCV
jgi:hypothetical protein